MVRDDGVILSAPSRRAPRRVPGSLPSLERRRPPVSALPSAPSVLPPFPWGGLLTLAGAIFVSVTSEFLPTGVLPDMGKGLGVGVATTGLLVSIFAGTVVVATTPLTTLTRRISRKRLVIVV